MGRAAKKRFLQLYDYKVVISKLEEYWNSEMQSLSSSSPEKLLLIPSLIVDMLPFSTPLIPGLVGDNFVAVISTTSSLKIRDFWLHLIF